MLAFLLFAGAIHVNLEDLGRESGTVPAWGSARVARPRRSSRRSAHACGKPFITAVPTSHASAGQAREAGIPLIDLDEDLELDLIVDGADEVAPNLDLVKGWGGALVQERIVASPSRR